MGKILKTQRLHPDARIPAYQSKGAACFDLHAVGGDLAVLGGQSIAVRTGLAFEVPEDHVMLVFSRSGHGFKNGIRLANCVGVIDADYRGEVMVKLHNDGEMMFTVETGSRIAQAMVLPVEQVDFLEVATLGETERGTAGLGSTGT